MHKNNITSSSIISTIKFLLLALILAAGVSYISAWTGPTATAPAGNVAAPINVGVSTQTKLGGLILNASTVGTLPLGLEVFGNSIFQGPIQIADGTQGAGKVLTSDASGTASWQVPSSSAGSSPSSCSSAPVSLNTFSGQNTTDTPFMIEAIGNVGYSSNTTATMSASVATNQNNLANNVIAMSSNTNAFNSPTPLSYLTLSFLVPAGDYYSIAMNGGDSHHPPALMSATAWPICSN